MWDDDENKLNFRRYRLHTRIVLSSTVVILIVSSVLFYLLKKMV